MLREDCPKSAQVPPPYPTNQNNISANSLFNVLIHVTGHLIHVCYVWWVHGCQVEHMWCCSVFALCCACVCHHMCMTYAHISLVRYLDNCHLAEDKTYTAQNNQKVIRRLKAIMLTPKLGFRNSCSNDPSQRAVSGHYQPISETPLKCAYWGHT